MKCRICRLPNNTYYKSTDVGAVTKWYSHIVLSKLPPSFFNADESSNVFWRWEVLISTYIANNWWRGKRFSSFGWLNSSWKKKVYSLQCADTILPLCRLQYRTLTVSVVSRRSSRTNMSSFQQKGADSASGSRILEVKNSSTILGHRGSDPRNGESPVVSQRPAIDLSDFHFLHPRARARRENLGWPDGVPGVRKYRKSPEVWHLAAGALAHCSERESVHICGSAIQMHEKMFCTCFDVCRQLVKHTTGKKLRWYMTLTPYIRQVKLNNPVRTAVALSAKLKTLYVTRSPSPAKSRWHQHRTRLPLEESRVAPAVSRKVQICQGGGCHVS